VLRAKKLRLRTRVTTGGLQGLCWRHQQHYYVCFACGFPVGGTDYRGILHYLWFPVLPSDSSDEKGNIVRQAD